MPFCLSVSHQQYFHINFHLQVYIKLGLYENASWDALKVLEMDDSHVKGLYRRGVSLLMYVHSCHNGSWLNDGVPSEMLEHLHHAKECFLRLKKEPEVALKSVPDDVDALMEQLDVLCMIEKAVNDDVTALVMLLHEDIDGTNDVDVCQVLGDLAQLVKARDVTASLAVLRKTQGLRLLWYFMTDATAHAVCELLSCMNESCVAWSRDVWEYVVGQARGSKGNVAFASECMRVLYNAMKDNLWVKNYLFTKPWYESVSIIQKVASTIGGCHLSVHCIGHHAVVHGCRMLALYTDVTKSDSTGSLRGANAVLNILSVVENADEIVKSFDGKTVQSDGVSLVDPEMAAKLELLKKREAVYNPDAIFLTLNAIECLGNFCKCHQLMVHECIEWKQGKKCASQVHHRLVALGRTFIQRCPKRSTKVLDANLNVISYEKMPYAADFNDNPAGDFLKNINLDDPGSLNSTGLQPASSPKDVIPLLDMFLECILMLTDIQLVNGLLYKADALGLCESLSVFVSESTVDLAQKICSRLVLNNTDAEQQLNKSSNATLIAGILKYSTDEALRSWSMKEITCLAASCSGNDYMRLVDAEHGILSVLRDMISNPNVSGYDRAIKLTDALARRMVESGKCKVLRSRNSIPKGYGWSSFHEEQLEDIMYRKHLLVNHEKEDKSDLSCFSKGFLGKNRSATVTPKAQNTAPQKNSSHATSSADDIESYVDQKQQKKKGMQEEPNVQGTPDAPKTVDIEDDVQVTEVYDSTPEEHVRASRIAWLTLKQEEKITWEQTSSDISIWVKVPKGTTTKELSVQASSFHITVSLKWYGKVLDGDLFGKIKSHEYTWCFSDDEIHITLPKDSTEHWWKTLIQGWEEKSYYELLKDAVNADEPQTSYDDMDESAKDLLDSMLERQAYINSGLLDLENGFDDFRIVLSDSSLKGGQSQDI